MYFYYPAHNSQATSKQILLTGANNANWHDSNFINQNITLAHVYIIAHIWLILKPHQTSLALTTSYVAYSLSVKSICFCFTQESNTKSRLPLRSMAQFWQNPQTDRLQMEPVAWCKKLVMCGTDITLFYHILFTPWLLKKILLSAIFNHQ